MRNTLKLTVAIACLAAVPSVALAATASAGGKPFAINCSSEQFKPKRITLACGDAGIWMSKLKWTSWSATSASATGTFNQNQCKPDCAAGHVKSYPIKVMLSKPKTCAGQTHLAFKQAALTFTATPAPKGDSRFSFLCPPSLPGGY